MQPGRYTELFFLDEATAFAAGHRPCAECRREDYERFRAIWSELHPGQTRAPAIDAQLHGERLAPPSREVDPRDLPDGAFVLVGETPCLVLGGRLLAWTPGGYVPGPAAERALLVTPTSLVEVLRTGWQGCVPLLHPSADEFRRAPRSYSRQSADERNA
jgi:hypothetical protein